MSSIATFDFSGTDAINGYATTERIITINNLQGSPIDLTQYNDTGGSLVAHFRTATNQQDPPVFTLVEEGTQGRTGIRILAPATAGRVRLTIGWQESSEAQERGLTSGVWDLIGYSSNQPSSSDAQLRAVLVSGSWTVDSQVTRDTDG